jgi:cyclophilin family peptidyl-prolyl cis-trans isomerase
MHTIIIIALVTFLMAGVSFAADAADAADGASATLDKFIADQKAAGKIDVKKAGWKTSLPKPPKATFDKDTEYFWVMETNKGTIKIKLLPETAPMHVSSTIYLAKLGFYDNLTFHRVITQFMAQGGCPKGSGTGGPGYEYDGEFDKSVKHSKPGLLSMANRGPGTDGSQFFLTFVPTSWLDGKHTIFGEVVDGMDVVKKLEAGGSENGKTTEPLGITKTTIEVKAKK